MFNALLSSTYFKIIDILLVVLVLAGVELIFCIGARMGLYVGFVLETVLIAGMF